MAQNTLTIAFTNSAKAVRERFAAIAPARKPGLWLWILFFVLNAILFLPAYLFHRADSTFFPPVAAVFHPRENADIFRISVEWAIVAAAWVNIGWLRQSWRRKALPVVFSALYFLILLYHIYENAISTYYHTRPNFYDDWLFVRSGIGFLLDGLQVPVWYFVIGAMVAAGGIWALARLVRLFFTIPVENAGNGSKAVGIALAGIIVILSFRTGGTLADPAQEASSFIAKLTENVRGVAVSAKEVAYVTNFNPHAVYNFENDRLREKPNIYLIFVESYGAVLYDSPYLRKNYLPRIETMDDTLREHGWHTASALSVSPTFGGGSWMAYTSAQYGIRISKQPQYLALREKYQLEPYPSLGRYLQQQGYEFMWVTPIARQLTAEDARKNDRFYAPDRWLLFADMNYHGPMYGWGPSPPDQFTLGFAQSFAAENVQKPLFMFYLTQNSHYPWAPLPPTVANWQNLNDSGIESPPALKKALPYYEHLKNYMASVDYTLVTLTDFIANTPDERAIFVLVGDHQPPIIARKRAGNATPIHIISKDANFVAQFSQYGFEEGLELDDLTPKMRHEGLYALLVHTLNARYGENPAALPTTMQRITTP